MVEGSANRPLLLVVDESPLARRLVAGALTDRYDIAEAGTAAEALDSAWEDKPDVIISAKILPDSDGITLIGMLRQVRGLELVPVIIVTGDVIAPTDMIESGAHDYISKGFTPEELQARVAAAVRMHRTLDEHRRLFQGTPVGLAARDASGRVVEANPALLTMLGFDELADAGDLRLEDLVVGPGSEELAGRIASGAPFSFSAELRRIDGTSVWVDGSIRAVDGASETAGGTELTLTDVTERHQMEVELRKEEERLRSLFEVSPVSLWEEDFGGSAAVLERLRGEGVTDLRAHFADHREDLMEAIEGIEVLAVNQSAADLVGAESVDDLVGRLRRELITESALPTLIEEMVAIWEDRAVFSFDLEGGALAGDAVEGLLSWRATVNDGKTDWTRVIVAITDITERRTQERALAAVNDHLNGLIEVGRSVTASLDIQDTLQSIVDEAQDFSAAGWARIGLIDEEKQTLTSVAGTTCCDVPQCGTTYEAYMQGFAGYVYRSGEAAFSTDIWTDDRIAGDTTEGRCMGGGTVQASVPLRVGESVVGTLSVLRDSDSQPFGEEDLNWLEMLASLASNAIANARLYDTAKAMRLEAETALEELGHAQSQLLQAQRLESIGELAAGIAHEINTPIQYVGDNTIFLGDSFGDLLAVAEAAISLAEAVASDGEVATALAAFKEAADDAGVEFLAEEIPTAVAAASEGVERVAAIVRSLKAFAHPGSEELAPVDVNKAVENTVTVSRNEWKYVAEMVLDLDPTLPNVPALAGPLNQVFLNIIVNAAQAIEDLVEEGTEKGTITISTVAEGSSCEIRISDTGGGIPDEVISRIFDPFFTTKEVGRGSGQGLSIARQVVVERHGGDLSVETRPGVGSTFVIRIPFEPVQVEEAA